MSVISTKIVYEDEEYIIHNGIVLQIQELDLQLLDDRLASHHNGIKQQRKKLIGFMNRYSEMEYIR